MEMKTQNKTGFAQKVLIYSTLGLSLLVMSSCKKAETTEPAPETSTVTDIDGNVYKTVKIGGKWWMAENLKVTKYADGTSINFVDSLAPDSIWANQHGGTYCSIDKRYGLLYNWDHINDSKQIAPNGWHIPTDAEWQDLEKALGMSKTEANGTGWRGTNEAEKIIPVASIGWPTASTLFGTNSSGFSALPGGCRSFNGSVNSNSNSTFWWTSSTNGDKVWYRNIDYTHKTILRYYTYKQYGFSIRCIKD